MVGTTLQIQFNIPSGGKEIVPDRMMLTRIITKNSHLHEALYLLILYLLTVDEKGSVQGRKVTVAP